VPANSNLPDGPRFFLEFSVFLNASTESLRVDCPIVKDSIGSNGQGILNSLIFVIDNNPAQDVGCELTSYEGQKAGHSGRG